MAAPKPEHEMTFESRPADDGPNGGPRTMAPHAHGGVAISLRQRPMWQTGKQSTFINPRTVLIALTTMLILLLTLQSPVCCDRVITTALALPAASEQPTRPAPTPRSQARDLTDENEHTLVASAAAVGAGTWHADAKTRAVIDTDVTANDPAPITATARAEAPVPSSSGIAAIRTDAASSLVAVSQNGFVKLAATGEVLDENAARWECVEDKHRRLTWEVKKNDGGMRDRDHSYSWLSEYEGKQHGIDNGGRCKGGISCDTLSYARAVNEQGLCGYSDWRLPTKEELETLVEYSDNPKQATIDKTYFPEAIPSWYWTASEHPGHEDYAWYVLFRNGVALNDLKERPKHIRLVRGQITQQ